MGRSNRKNILERNGFTLIELLIAVLITGIISAASFQFYVTMQQQVVTQQSISDMQQISRSSLQEMGETLRMAGYMVPSYEPYEINGCSLTVNYSTSGTEDDLATVTYFLEEYSDTEYAKVVFRPDGMLLYKLMKEVDGGGPELFADFITSIQYTPIPVMGAPDMAITLEVTTSKGDETFNANDGFRKFVNTERVNMRNVSM